MSQLFSADSHVNETEACWAEIDPAFRERRPRARFDPEQGAQLVVPGLDFAIPSGKLSRAGIPVEDWGRPLRWEELHPAGHESSARLAIQDEDGIAGEVIYPSAGLVLCQHEDVAYKKACFEAYNRWLEAFCEPDPRRLVGIGLAAVPSPEEGVKELEAIAAAGFGGVMLCGDPAFEDYDHPSYDPLWEAAVSLGLPVSLHILTVRDPYIWQVRGPQVIQQIVTLRGIQNIVLMMIFGGVFARHPDLRIVMAENDAGWIPHFCFRMDHAWERHRHSLPTGPIERRPSEYMLENVYATFQDDWSVRHVADVLNLERVMWASDYPHGDGTYPDSAAFAEDVTRGLADTDRARVLSGNARALYRR